MLSSFTGKKNEGAGAPFGNNAALPPGIPTPSSMPHRAARPGAGPSVIGPDLVIIGDLVSNGHVQVDGEIQGDIHGTHIVIGEGARITGGIVSEEVVVRGTVMGSIRGRKVMLQAESKVEGDIFHKSLAIEQGAYFEGKSRRSEDPLAGVERPELSVDTGPTFD